MNSKRRTSFLGKRLENTIKVFTKVEKELEALCIECDALETELLARRTSVSATHVRARSILDKLKGLIA